MKNNEVILTRQKAKIRFKNGDMDFIFNWFLGVSQLIGLSPAQVFFAVNGIREGDPREWREGFRRQGYFQWEQAAHYREHGRNLLSGQAALGAAFAYRAALQYTSPSAAEFRELIDYMEESFQEGARMLGVPLRPVEIPFAGTSLPGYFLEHDRQPRPLLVMIGGGDTFREDLFPFAGYPGWKRGYNVLMADLPGQGKCPDRGLHFRADMAEPVAALIDWAATNAAVKDGRLAMYGVSGGGFISAQSVARDERIKAWIASTPLIDLVRVFRAGFGNAAKAPGPLTRTLIRLAGTFNESAQINLDKYAWQFGVADFKAVMDGVLEQARPVDYTSINCPSLFLVGEGEERELKRQTSEVHDDLRRRGVDVTLRETLAAEGADAHCQVNNLRLAHLVIFDWLDRAFGRDPAGIDSRLLV
jgi:hypothetical protein